MKKGLLDQMSIAEAIDNLTNMTDLDSSVLEFGPQNEPLFFSKWFDSKDRKKTIENIKLTFAVILDYFKEVSKKDKEKLKGEDGQKGIRSMMILAEEAAEKIDRYTNLFSSEDAEKSVKQLPEFKELNEFYEKKLLKKIKGKEEEKELWFESLDEEISQLTQHEQKGLKDLQSVKEDTQYELFMIKKEDGKPFFNKNLLRHIKLVHDFDRIVVSELSEDPFLLAEKVKAKSAMISAKQIKTRLNEILKPFLKAYPFLKNSQFYLKLNQALYALVLAASKHNLLEEGARKSCYNYIHDFSTLLQESFDTSDYHALSELYFEELNELMRNLMLCAYHMVYDLFYHIGEKDQTIGYINQLMGKSSSIDFSKQMWTRLLESNQHLNQVLKKYPSGPLFKLLDHFHLGEDEVFEPLNQTNHPRLLYSIKSEVFDIEVLRIPSPTKQEMINKAEGSMLFKVFAKSLKVLKNSSKLLFINMQDRTSWQDSARCQYIEGMQSQSEFSDLIEVTTLAKDTSFYHQKEEYLSMHQAEDFKKLLAEQIASGGGCGFYFSQNLKFDYLSKFVTDIIDLIHLHFFGSKEVLSRKNRLDFIEIFYFFLTLKLIDLIRPTDLSLSCKDAIDTSAAATAGLYGFIKLFSPDDLWNQEEEDFFVWMMQSAALTQRDRSIHQERFERVVSALMVVHAEMDGCKGKILNSFEKAFGYPIFRHLVVKEAKE